MMPISEEAIDVLNKPPFIEKAPAYSRSNGHIPHAMDTLYEQ